uniref:Uncharacterized protein n=1 Tax=Terrapene triunguis TaxID=2587831 RepID=A0A674JUI5_9SAUR
SAVLLSPSRSTAVDDEHFRNLLSTSVCLPSIGISAEGNLRTRHVVKGRKSEAKLKVPGAAPPVSMDPFKSTGDPTGQQVSKHELFLF